MRASDRLGSVSVKSFVITLQCNECATRNMHVHCSQLSSAHPTPSLHAFALICMPNAVSFSEAVACIRHNMSVHSLQLAVTLASSDQLISSSHSIIVRFCYIYVIFKKIGMQCKADIQNVMCIVIYIKYLSVRTWLWHVHVVISSSPS
jgi:hypothetical protein